MAIYDTMQFVRPNMVTTCVGQAASMAALPLTAGTAKKRFSLPNPRVLMASEIQARIAVLHEHSDSACGVGLETRG